MCESKDIAIQIEDVGKTYKIHPSNLSRVLEAFGLLGPARRFLAPPRDFLALDGVNLSIRKGERIGIIGANGAGKSTLLKLIVGNLQPTHGRIDVDGEVQALMTTGAGFHPEFTGRQNAEASLSQLGLTTTEIDEAMKEIIEFTELDEFMDQAFKTYSAGMQARLTFATATAIKPEIVIIDEILGAGDGYFISKSTERIDRLVRESGATVLLVSHDLQTVQKFCDRAIWMERGRVRLQGPTLEVVKQYSLWLRGRTESRLQAKNAQRASGHSSRAEMDTPDGRATISLMTTGGELLTLRSLEVRIGDRVAATLLSNASTVESGVDIEVADNSITATTILPANIRMSELVVRASIDSSSPIGIEGVLQINGESQTSLLQHPGDGEYILDFGGSDDPNEQVVSWIDDVRVALSNVRMTDADDHVRAVYDHGESLHVSFHVSNKDDVELLMTPVVVIHRKDGVVISQLVGPEYRIAPSMNEPCRISMSFDELNLGDGDYVASIGIYESIHPEENTASPYVIHDRAYEFQVRGNPPMMTSVFRHPCRWTAAGNLSECIDAQREHAP